jgi:hypothetical protein
MASDIRRSLVVAFASRELMAPDPGDRKVCSWHSSSTDQNFAGINEKSLDKDRGS